VTTKKGLVFTGIKVRQTETELVLRDAEDRPVSIPLDAIEEQTLGGSLMPEGLTDSLTRAELIDLVRFLSELGKVDPYRLNPTITVARRWQVLEATDTSRQVLSAGLGPVAREAAWQTWSSAYSSVAGQLPLDDLPRFRRDQDSPGLAVVRCQIEVTKPGRAKLLWKSTEGLTVWLDGVATEARPEMLCDLTKGVHTLTVGIDLGKRREGLRCELAALNVSEAQVNFIGGK
jgi:hypothetical protein